MVLLKIGQVSSDATLNLLLRDVNSHMQQVNDRRRHDHEQALDERDASIRSLRILVTNERAVKESLRKTLAETNVKLSQVTSERDALEQVDRTFRVNLFIVVASVVVSFVCIGWTVYNL